MGLAVFGVSRTGGFPQKRNAIDNADRLLHLGGWIDSIWGEDSDRLLLTEFFE